MATIGNNPKPAYVFDAESDTWVPIGVGPHTHSQYLDISTVSAKGDLIVGTASQSVANLPVGVDGQVLVADSSDDVGVVWQTLNALPSQSGNTGKYLTTNGSTASWAEIVTDPVPQIFLLMGA